MANTTVQKAMQWLTDDFDSDTQNQVTTMMKENPEELNECFYQDLSFGTGGIRGVMGVGTNRINKYTLGKATQGLANYLLKKSTRKTLKVAIAYDSRNHSQSLSKEVAHVLTANNIEVLFYESLRTTPQLSFTIRHLNCDAGIVLTASHNPPAYNGYKVYWNDGGQLVPPQDIEIIEEINKVSFKDIKRAENAAITMLGEAMDQIFIEACIKHSDFQVENRSQLAIVFTPLHGTTVKSVPEALKRAGFSNTFLVEEQTQPDGNFPTVKSPNPEDPEALKMALDLAQKKNADIVIGTDPDGDRLGVAIKDEDNNYTLLNGNQTMCLLIDFLLKKYKEQNLFKGNEFVATTIVSTDLVNEIAQTYRVKTKTCLTGFKWIGKMIRESAGKEHFIAGGEESFGFMVGDFLRDKDAVTSTILVCEMAAEAKNKGINLKDQLLELYKKHHFYKERLISLTKKGVEGMLEIKQLLHTYRTQPFKTINGIKVDYINDYQSSKRIRLEDNTEEVIDLPASNVLIYELNDGSKIAIRPSGTEPKIKYYLSVKAKLDTIDNATTIEKQLDAKIDDFISFLKIS